MKFPLPVRSVGRWAAWTVALAAFPLFAQPTDNPVKSFYNGPTGYPVWTDGLRWSNVVNMATYTVPGEPTADNFRKFEHARDALHAAGGGVLYYPAGDYSFVLPNHSPNGGRGLMLKSGVVIRGEEPATDKYARPVATYPWVTPNDDLAADGVLPLGTKFFFETVSYKGGTIPKSSWNIVGILPGNGESGIKDVNNVGIVWVEINHGSIFVGPDHVWAPKWDGNPAFLGNRTRHDAPNGIGAAGNWWDRVPDGTHPGDTFCGALNPGGLPYSQSAKFTGEADGVLVFGVSIVNGAPLNDFYYSSGRGVNGGPAHMHLYRFAGRISVYGSNLFVANNNLPQPTLNFIRPEFVNTNGAGATSNTGLSFKNVSDGAMTTVGTTTTVVLTTHGYTTGDFVTVDRVLETNYLGVKGPITVLDANTFTFTVPEGTPATATRAASNNSMRLAKLFNQNILFDFANTIGIDINKSLLGLSKPTDAGDAGYFGANVIVRDNFVFNRGNKGFEISGNWVKIINNYNRRFWLGYRMPDSYAGIAGQTIGNTLDGWAYQGSGENSNDYLSRGYDLGGKNMWMHDNHVINTGSTGNDGEGLLIQRHNNFETYSWAYTDNSTSNTSEFGPGTSGEGSYIGGYDVHHFGILFARNSTPGNVGHLKGIQGGSTPNPNDGGNLFLEGSAFGNTAGGYSYGSGWDARTAANAAIHPFAPHQNGSDGSPFGVGFQTGAFDGIGQGFDGTRGLTLAAGSTTAMGHPSQAPVHNDPVSAPDRVQVTRRGDNAVEITYNDTANNEFGFRIQRRIGTGAWQTIAYRPRQSILHLYRPSSPTANDGIGFPLRPRQDRSHPDNEVFAGGLRKDPWSTTPIWDLNPEKWVDYTAPTGVDLEYRVIALNGTDVKSDTVEPDASMGRATKRLEAGGGGGTPFEQWVARFANLPEGKRNFLDDAAGDGIVNLLKFAFANLDPTRNDRGVFPPRPQADGTDLVLTFPKSAEGVAAGLQYLAQIYNGTNWVEASTIAGVTVTDTAASVVVRLPAALAGANVRVRVVLP